LRHLLLQSLDAVKGGGVSDTAELVSEVYLSIAIEIPDLFDLFM
jgi:hypothetical protein